MAEKRETYPVQVKRFRDGQGKAPVCVVEAAYEVYCHLYGPQPSMMEGGCRGGFGACELVAFLYAKSFPKEQWYARATEAFKNMEI